MQARQGRASRRQQRLDRLAGRAVRIQFMVRLQHWRVPLNECLGLRQASARLRIMAWPVAPVINVISFMTVILGAALDGRSPKLGADIWLYSASGRK